jgi:carbon monoxide dehydrogenase subunit G
MRVEKTIVVERPVERVFAFITDMHKVKLWLPVDNIRQTSSGPIGMGSTFAQEAQFLGQRFQATSIVTRYEPPHVFALKIQGPFALTNSMYCESTKTGGTKLTMVGEADPGPAVMLMGPLIVPLVTKQVDTQINLLKRALETQA